MPCWKHLLISSLHYFACVIYSNSGIMLTLWNLLPFSANLNLGKENSHSVLDLRSMEDVEQQSCQYWPEIPAQRKQSEQELVVNYLLIAVVSSCSQSGKFLLAILRVLKQQYMTLRNHTAVTLYQAKIRFCNNLYYHEMAVFIHSQSVHSKIWFVRKVRDRRWK